MDNKAYLDQIAVKGKVKSGPLLSPFIIKLLAAGLILLVTLIIIGSVFSGSSDKALQSYERVYMRIANLVDSKGPIKANIEKTKDPNLRSYTASLLSSLNTTNVALAEIATSIGIKPKEISITVQNEEAANIKDLTTSLENARATGTFDRTYAAKVAHQIDMLLIYEQAARSKTPSVKFAELLDKSTADLTILQEQFKKFNESN